MAKTVTDVLGALRMERGDETERYIELLADGRGLHVDFGEGDQVFEVRVRRISRRWLALPPVSTVGRVDDTIIAVRSVAVANHVEVSLDRADSHNRAMPAPIAGPTPWPADRVMRKFHVAIRDDLSTVYRVVSAEAGGEEHPWRVHLRFLPLPPPNAAVLHVDVSAAKVSRLRMVLRLVT